MEMEPLLERWRTGPIGRPPRPRPVSGKAPLVFSTRPWSSSGDRGDPGRPSAVSGVPVIEQLRTRRDGTAGAVVALADGRYAFTGPIVAIGSPGRLQQAARRRLAATADDAERAWWREVVGALSEPEEA